MKRILLVWLLCLASVAGWSDAPAYSFRHYTVRDGLSANTVRALIQDRKGMIWLGTSDGLDSFDGKEILHHPIGTEGSRYVNALFEDADQVLWVGTDDAVFRLMEDSLYRLPGFPETNATGFAQDRDGSVWISSFEDGVSRWRDGTLTRFLEGEVVEYLLVSKDGRLWVADTSAPEGLYVFNPASGTFVSPGLRFDGCTPARVCAICQDGDGILWLGTWDQGLYRLDPATRTVRRAVPPGKGFNHVHSLTEISPWTFLIGSDDGLLYVNPLTGEQRLYGNDRKDPASLSNKFVYPIVLDHEGGIWIGTYYGGVNYIAPGSSVFSFLSLSDLTDADEVFAVSCLCEDPDGTLWMGSDNGGLFRYDPGKGTASRHAPARFAPKNIHALLRQGDFLWIGTYSSDLIRLNVRTGQEKVYTWEDGLSAHDAYSLCLTSDGTLWVGTNLGICRYDPVSDRFVQEQSTSDVITGIVEDRNGTLWVATSGKGLLQRSPDGAWRELTVRNAGLPSNEITCLLPPEKGVYAATRNGLVLFLGEEKSVYLEGMDIQYLTDDGTQLWFTTPSSLVRFVPDTGALEQFGASDGIRSGQFLRGSGLTTREGRIYLGATDGVISFFPGGVVENPIPPTVLFTRFHALGPGMDEDVLRTQKRDDIRISWRKRDLRFSFAALSYCAPEKVRYAYRLEGLEPYWKNLENQNTLSLDRVPAGHYRLQVIACNNSGVWNQEGASLSFTIRPHPLLSKAALTLYVLLGFLLITLLVRWLLRRTERKTRVHFEQKLDEAVTQVKEEERDDRYQFVSSLADQLEAPLAGIGTQLERLKDHPKALSDIKGEITLIEKNHRMLKGVSGSLKLLRGTLAPENAPEETVPAGQEDFLTRLDRLISENLANPTLSVPFLAKEMAISRSGLFAKVKQLTGETPNNLINQTRLNAAAKLLSEGKHSVGEICYLTGFSSPSYFSKSFSAQFGFTPYEWMQKNKNA